MGTLAMSEDPDEMQQIAAFHQGMHCLLRLKHLSRTEIHHNLENSTCDPLKCKTETPYLLYQWVWENPYEYKELSCSSN